MFVQGIIRRTFPFLDVDGFNCNTMFILAALVVLCSGLIAVCQKDIDCMEKGQRRATKMVYGFWNLKYKKRLERLNLFSLQYTRMRGDMIETYKIISCLEDVNLSLFFGQVWTISVDTA